MLNYVSSNYVFIGRLGLYKAKNSASSLSKKTDWKVRKWDPW